MNKTHIEYNNGKNYALIHAEKDDTKLIAHLKDMLKEDIFKESRATFMPDVHKAGKTAVGLTMLIRDKIDPELIGADIGCGVTLAFTNYTINETFYKLGARLDYIVNKYIPIFTNYKVPLGVIHRADLYQTNLFVNKDLKGEIIRGFRTLGNGNHFIEAYSYDGKLVLAVHTGSRTLGGEIHKYYVNEIIKKRNVERNKRYRQKVVDELKSEGRHSEIENTLKMLDTNNLNKKYLTGEDMEDYINDVKTATMYASDNRRNILSKILNELDPASTIEVAIDKPHNYIDTMTLIDNYGSEDETYRYEVMLRKGAQEAIAGHYVLIPINMRDGMIVGKVKTELDSDIAEDWNYSAPHGAGRVLSRTQAKNSIYLKDLEETMKDVYSTSLGLDTIDEAPEAYNSLDYILENTKEILEDYFILKPIYNFKG